jgi:hypothetical protein
MTISSKKQGVLRVSVEREQRMLAQVKAVRGLLCMYRCSLLLLQPINTYLVGEVFGVWSLEANSHV